MVQTKYKTSARVSSIWPERIPVANTYIGEAEAKAAYDVIKAGWLSMGKKVAEFEKDFAAYVDAPEAISVSNGTAALHAVLVALGIGEGDEVIIPSLTFISTANVVLYEKAEVVLAECDPDTYNITAKEIEKRITKKTKAVIAVDMNGLPIEYDEIIRLCDKKGITLIADSAESLGALYKGKKVGSIADIHCFSFFPNKNITTGEGGMITTNNKKLADALRQIRHQGQEKRYHHVRLGYNYRLTEFQAAIGIEQLKRVDDVIADKQKLASRYNELLSGVEGIEIPFIPDSIDQTSWYMYPIKVSMKIRDKVVAELEKRNIETRLSFPPIHMQPYYQNEFGYKDSSLPITRDAWKALIDIPIWKDMGTKRQDYIVKSLKEIIAG